MVLGVGRLDRGDGAAAGGVDLASLANSGSSAGGADTVYAATGWGTDKVRLLFGTPDANGDRIPDIWTVRVDGSVRFYAGNRVAISDAGTTIISSTGGGWKSKPAMG